MADTKPRVTLKQLQEAGHKVKVTHIRPAHLKDCHPTDSETDFWVPSSMRGDFVFCPRGGNTVVKVLASNGDTHLTQSKCHEVDNFCYDTAIQTALDKLHPDVVDRLLKPLATKQ